MSRRILVTAAIVVGLLVLTGVLLSTNGDVGVKRAGTTEESSAREAPAHVMGVPMGEAPALASRRAHAAAEETLQILVVAKDTQLPVAGALVSVVDSEALAGAPARERCARDTPRGSSWAASGRGPRTKLR